MAMKKISELDEIYQINNDDLFVVVDTTLEDTNKITKENAFSGMQKSISSSNKVNADYIDDSTSTNKFVTASDKTTWSGKQDHLTAGTGIDITNNVISNTQTSAEWGNITGTLADQTDLKNALDGKANSSDLSTVATSGSYADLSNKPTIPDELADLSDDSTHRLVTDTEKTTWNNKSDFSGSYNDLSNKPTIPTKVSDLQNDSGFITIETDPVFTASASYGISSSDISSWTGKQDALVSGTNIKTINNQSLLGSGNIDIQGGGGSSYTAGDGINIDANNVISANVSLIQSTASANDKGSDSTKRLNLSDLIPGRYTYKNYSSASGTFYYTYTFNSSSVNDSITVKNSQNNENLSWNAFVIDVYKDLTDTYSLANGTIVARCQVFSINNSTTTAKDILIYNITKTSTGLSFNLDTKNGDILTIFTINLNQSTSDTTTNNTLKAIYNFTENSETMYKPYIIIGKKNNFNPVLGNYYKSGSIPLISFGLTSAVQSTTSASTSYGCQYYTYYSYEYEYTIKNGAVNKITKYDKEYQIPTNLSSNGPLGRTNTTSYTPTANYHPATKLYVDEKTGVSLYENTSGDNGDIILSETTANYNYIEIFYKTNDDVYSSVKVYNPDGKKVSFTTIHPTSTGQTTSYAKTKEMSISGTSITNLRYSEIVLDHQGPVLISGNNYIYIIKVIGYK